MIDTFDKLVRLDRESPKTILFIGDGMNDVYVHGRIESCQDGCPKFISDTAITVGGGVFNAYASIEKWNSRRYCQGENDTIKTRFMVNGKIAFRYDCDVRSEPFANMDYVHRAEPDAILMSDYDKGFLSEEMIRQIIDYATERKIPCVVDAKREPSLYDGAILKCNKDYESKYEFEFLNSSVTPIVTQGQENPYYFQKNNEELIFQSGKEVRCVSHVGAGDCFSAHLVLALANGLTIEESIPIAHSAGRVYVQHPHNRPPWPHEVRKDIDPLRGKIIDASDVAKLRESTHQKIVFANGCFDLFGPHHLYYLNEAKKHGDLLVVGVNSDESVRHLKGVGRPVIPQEQRAMLIAGLESVDWVVVFDDQTPEKIMESLSPDVRAVVDLKMEGRCINGDELAKQIVSIKPMSGWSTTHTMTKIQNSPR